MYMYTYLNNHPEEGRQEYLKHNADVRAVNPKDKFPEFNFKHGWGPLCEFLKVPVFETPLPRANDATTFLGFVDNV